MTALPRKSLEQTVGLLRSMERSVNADDVRQFLLSYLKDFGVEYFFAGTIPTPGMTARQQQGHVLLASYPDEWQRRYFSRGYLYRDPIVRSVCSSTESFIWSDIRGRSQDAGETRVLDEAADCGIGAGFTVPMLTLDGSSGGFSFAGERLETSLDDRRALILIANFAFAHLLLLNERPVARPVALAPRERESLQWAAEGKTDWEIGELMGISEHGADRHLRAARRKLGTYNRTHAVALAMRLGLIS